MTAWTILTEGSTAPSSSTAWEHLNAQGGGATKTFYEETTVILDSDLEVELETSITVTIEENMTVILEEDNETTLPTTLDVTIND